MSATRGTTAFEYLEAQDIKYEIRPPKNSALQEL